MYVLEALSTKIHIYMCVSAWENVFDRVCVCVCVCVRVWLRVFVSLTSCININVVCANLEMRLTF